MDRLGFEKRQIDDMSMEWKGRKVLVWRLTNTLIKNVISTPAKAGGEILDFQDLKDLSLRSR